MQKNLIGSLTNIQLVAFWLSLSKRIENVPEIEELESLLLSSQSPLILKVLPKNSSHCISVIEEGINVFVVSGTHFIFFKTLLVPGFAPIVLSQFVKVNISTVGAFAGKMILTLSKG